ncbi:MAG: penicillin-binding protein activator LpoB [Treponema sp.]|jgi:TolB-like protein|nr:penicillin-binding protein activator LpoB [Treponema sp.]
MKRLILPVFFLATAVFCFGQTGTIDSSIGAVKSSIESILPAGSHVLIVFNAPAKQAADYAADELSARLVAGKRIVVVERSADVMAALNAETGYQLSGEVSDDSIQSIGHKTGAQYVITGRISGSGDNYRMVVKLTGIKSGKLEGQWNVAFQSSPTLDALLANTQPPRGRPDWVDNPQAGAAKHGSAGWYYDVGVSNKAASEQLARTRARQNIQQMTAENIASNITAHINVDDISLFYDSQVEDPLRLIQTAVRNSVQTRVPASEPLEWYVEKGKDAGGKEYFIVYVLVRFQRKDIFGAVNSLEPERVADTVLRQARITTATVTTRTEFVEILTGAKTGCLTNYSD